MKANESTEVTRQEAEALDILGREFAEVNRLVERVTHRGLKNVGIIAGITGGFFTYQDQARGLAGAYRGCAFRLLECLKKAHRFAESGASAEYRTRHEAMERTGWETLTDVLERRASHLASLLRQVAERKSVPLIRMALKDAASVVSSDEDGLNAAAGAVAEVLLASKLSGKEAIQEEIARSASRFLKDSELAVTQACDVLERADSGNEAAHYKRMFLPP